MQRATVEAQCNDVQRAHKLTATRRSTVQSRATSEQANARHNAGQQKKQWSLQKDITPYLSTTMILPDRTNKSGIPSAITCMFTSACSVFVHYYLFTTASSPLLPVHRFLNASCSLVLVHTPLLVHYCLFTVLVLAVVIIYCDAVSTAGR